MLRKGGGEEARCVRCTCDACAAHGDRAAVGVDVDAQGSGLGKDMACISVHGMLPVRANSTKRNCGYAHRKYVLKGECRST